ncbi:hypothetical protein [Actinoplanes sp. NPDC051851]|uniref:hypothetical protein n=1 Tax=Actinoplanes sp. NPDC051851 TaxID=3154753 RepID=UPI003414643F
MKPDRRRHVDHLAGLAAAYPIISIEDGVAQDDMEGWKALTVALGDRCQLVGDDVSCTNAAPLRQGIADGVADASDRTATYNRPLRTEEEPGPVAAYAGRL